MKKYNPGLAGAVLVVVLLMAFAFQCLQDDKDLPLKPQTLKQKQVSAVYAFIDDLRDEFGGGSIDLIAGRFYQVLYKWETDGVWDHNGRQVVDNFVFELMTRYGVEKIDKMRKDSHEKHLGTHPCHYEWCTFMRHLYCDIDPAFQ